ncbi:MAG TPA: helix-turn-helix domain-containing protein [Solirubrobacteraceae bacterium]|jgi:AcrR family transcriptional regulator
MATTPAPRWQRLDHDERRRQILACARRLFSERHYAAVSTSEIAREAGVARGLLHHYFRTKRELYLEVVRALVRVPSHPVPEADDGRTVEEQIEDSVGRWLETLRRNRGTWLAANGAQGLGRDPEVEAILEQAREHAIDSLIVAIRPGDPATAPPELRAVLRAYSGFAEAASLEWLERRRLTREQAHALVVQGFFSIVRDALPAVERLAPQPGRASNGNRKINHVRKAVQ